MPIVSGGTVAFGPAAALVETGIMLFIGGLLTIRVWQSRRCVVSENQASHPIYIKVRGQEKYLYRAVDSTGQTIDFLLTAKRDAAPAKRFFRKVFSSPSTPIPRVINVDKNAASPPAVKANKKRVTLPRRVRLRQCKFL